MISSQPACRVAGILVGVGKSRVWCFGGLVFARFLPIPLLVPLVAAMLALSTPVGTGGQEHQFDLLHPVFPHAHLIDGRIVSPEQVAAEKTSTRVDAAFNGRPPGQALGAGDAADADGFGMGLVPTLPLMDMALPRTLEEGLPTSASERPREFREPPEDPPPNASA